MGIFLIALFCFRIPSSLGRQFLALFGLMLITISVLFFDNHFIPPFPNCYTLLPTFGTTLIIIFGNQNTLVGRLLSIRPLRWVGLISYSAYLWHQPLLAYLRLRSIGRYNVSYINFIIVTVFLLSTITYFLVEQPFRNRTLLSRRHIFRFSSIGTLLMFLAALFLIHTSNNRSRAINQAGNNQSSTKTEIINTWSVIMNEIRNNRSLNMSEEVDTYLFDIEPNELSHYTTRRFDNHMLAYSTFSNESASTNRRILLIGDSFAQEFMNMAAETGKLVDYEIRVYYVRYYCQIYMGSEDRLQWIGPGHRSLCINEYDVKFALPLIREANIIILAGCWLKWSAQRLPKTIELLNITKNQRLFVLGVKNFGKMDLKLYPNTSYEYRVRQFQQPEEDFVEVNTIMKKGLDKSIFVDILSMICVHHNGTCPVFTPYGKIISYDGWHVTRHGALYVGDIIFKNFPLNQL